MDANCNEEEHGAAEYHAYCEQSATLKCGWISRTSADGSRAESHLGNARVERATCRLRVGDWLIESRQQTGAGAGLLGRLADRTVYLIGVPEHEPCRFLGRNVD
jgi:hypothetical protein